MTYWHNTLLDADWGENSLIKLTKLTSQVYLDFKAFSFILT